MSTPIYKLVDVCGEPCPNNCLEPAVGTITCVSQQGNGSLCGWSKWQNENTGDWNLRKYQTTVITGRTDTCGGASCVNSVRGHQWPGSAKTFSACSAPVQNGTITNEKDGGDCGSYVTTTTQTGHLYSTAFLFPSPGFENENATGAEIAAHVITVLADNSRTLTGDGSCWTAGSGEDVKVYGTLLETLSGPDSVAAALLRGTPTTGSACKTTAGTIGSTTAHVTTAISITSTTAVTATIPCSSLIASTAYTITVEINRYTAGGGGFVDTIQDTIDFTATASSEDVEYEVPVNTDFDYEIVTGTATIAYA